MQTVTVYSRAGCAKCESTKRQLKAMGVAFTELVIEKDVTRNEVMAMFPGVTSLPILSQDGERITIEDLK